MNNLTPEKTQPNIVTKKAFSEEVEHFARDLHMTYIDSIVHVCELRTIEPNKCKRLLSDSILSKVESEAMDLNIIPKGNKLPL